MTKAQIIGKVSRGVHKVGFIFKKHSPELLLAAGIAGVITSTVVACKATTKLEKVLEKPKDTLDKIHEYVEETGYSDEYTEADYKKDVAVTYVQSGVAVAKLYAPAVVVGAVSIAAILASHNIMRKRNLAIAAAYTALDRSFKEYRGRVIERFSKELDQELKYDIKVKEIEETVTNEDGSESVVKKTVNAADPANISPYARFFDETCRGWVKNADRNKFFLLQQQNYLNDKLKRQGYLFLNDMYTALGMDVTPIGQIVGWIYDEGNPIGDNCVDFGLFDIENEAKRLFINGHERSVLIDPNVDGVVYDLL